MAVGNLLVASLLIPLTTTTIISGVAANIDATSTKKHEKFVPLVAFECGYRNKYMNEDGVWISDENRYATCLSGKLDILKYCKKAYPKLNITNIVEYSHEMAIENWCREEGKPCKWTHTVRPYQCIDGEFKSEALQVPHDCRFSHVNSGESCNDYQHWRDEATKQCSIKTFNGKPMSVRSFAVLEPCSLDLFTGVEFVCCPSIDKITVPVVGARTIEKANKLPKDEEDDDDYDEEYDESDEESSDEKSSEGQDPYFKNKDPANEHENFKDAEDRLDKKHREKIEKVMKEWGELEARYQQMKTKDAKGAESFKVSMTNRFQKTVASLEDEHKRLKKQLETTHEERVQAILNEKKRTATHEYRQALAMHDKSANKHHVLKTLKTYIRSEEKDRIHTINRYRHLLRVDQAEAAAFKPTVLHRLRYIDLRINGTLAMLRDFPDLESQVRPIAVAYWSDLRRENTPELSDSAINALNSLDSDAKNKKLVDLYREAYEKSHPNAKLDVKAPPTTTTSTTTTTQKTTTQEPAKLLSEDSHDSEEDDDEYYEDEDDEEVKKNPIVKKPKVIEYVRKEEVKKPEPPKLIEKSVQTEPITMDDDSNSDESDEESIKELRVDIEPIIEEKPAFYRQEKLIQTQKSMYQESGLLSSSQVVFIVAAVAIVSLTMLVATVVRRRRAHHGFIEVDVYTPEERHVAGMQVNGYENPTYSFFDSKA
ncbi:hypothetical protein V3C99_017637 [Haemonchus contortus]|uniref:Beta-amyloid-like protein n=1 Tax=Haemonchus contortus TaxID=6289 RepID=A0A7I4Z3R4_HAECO|nr:Amyloidogenic glycoprotein and Beta-amyloid precursor protein C-terminal domain containing protein [Haemonchus contortus]